MGIPLNLGERIGEYFELSRKGREVAEEDVIAELEKIAPKSWLINEDLAQYRFKIEMNLRELREAINDCNCGGAMDSLILGIENHTIVWQLIEKSNLSDVDKRILRDDLIKILDELYNSSSRFAYRCECTSRLIKRTE